MTQPSATKAHKRADIQLSSFFSQSEGGSQGRQTESTRDRSPFEKSSAEGKASDHGAARADLSAASDARLTGTQITDENRKQNQNTPAQTQLKGPGVRADSQSSAPNRCTTPQDFPDFSLKWDERKKVAEGALDIVGGVYATVQSAGFGAALGMAAAAKGAANIAEVVDSAFDRGLKAATPGQIRCFREAQQQQAANLQEKSLSKRSF